MSENRKDEIDGMRRAMNTLPEQNTQDSSTKFHAGVSGVSVELFEAPANPYRAIFEASVATWGSDAYPTAWGRVSPENRFRVVKAALSGQTLPQALEPVQFLFIARGASRAAFDQHARQRIGATFFSSGVRDNSRLAASFVMPSELLPENGGDEKLHAKIVAHVLEFKKLYKEILDSGPGSYQAARCIMPMNLVHPYKWSVALSSLKAYIGQRVRYCEMADTVAVAMCAWKAVHDRFPLIASHCKPTCDYAKKCLYHVGASLSEAFGCLFRGCGRWEDTSAPYATFNRSCSDPVVMDKELGFRFPRPTEWKEYSVFEELYATDKELFTCSK